MKYFSKGVKGEKKPPKNKNSNQKGNKNRFLNIFIKSKVKDVENVNDVKNNKVASNYKMKRTDSLFFKILISSLCFVIIPMLFVTIISYVTSSNSITSKVTESYLENVKNNIKSMDSQFKAMRITSQIIIGSQDFVRQMQSKHYDIGKNTDFSTQISAIGQRINGLDSQAFYSERNQNNFVYGQPNLDFSDIAESYYKKIGDKDTDAVGMWVAPWQKVDDDGNSYVFTYGGKFLDFISSGDVLGFYASNFKVDMLKQYVNSKLGENGYYYMVDENGRVISISDRTNKLNKYIYKVSPDKFVKSKILNKIKKDYIVRTAMDEAMPESSQYNYNKFNDGNNIILYGTSKETGWTVIGVLPKIEITKSSNAMLVVSIIACLLFGLFGAFLAFCIARSIVKPIKRLVAMMKKTEDGDFTIKVSSDRRDEIGLLFNGFGKMIENLKDLITDIEKTSVVLLDSSNTIAEGSKQAAKATQDSSVAINEIAKGTCSQAEDALNSKEKMEHLAHMIGIVSSNSQNVAINSQDVIKVCDSGSKIVDVLNEKAKQTEDITFSISTKVSNLGTRVKDINKIINVINEIAEQTNLLSLNAAIEAARAGEAGKGFAVVAGEVRRLSMRVSEATLEINNIIKDVQAQTQETVQYSTQSNVVMSQQMQSVTKTEEAFKTIREAVTGISKQIEEVSIYVSDMNSGSEQVAESIDSISAVSQQTAAVAQEVSAATEQEAAIVEQLSIKAIELEELAEKLGSKIEKFKVD